MTIALERPRELLDAELDRFARCTDVRITFAQCSIDIKVPCQNGTAARWIPFTTWATSAMCLTQQAADTAADGLADLDISRWVDADGRPIPPDALECRFIVEITHTRSIADEMAGAPPAPKVVGYRHVALHQN